MSWTADIANSFGVSEAGLKLIIGQFLAYPLLFFYRKFVSTKESTLQHIFITLGSVAIAYWSLGFSAIYHGTICIIGTYLILFFMKGSVLSASIGFLFNMIYLTMGYYIHGTEGYDVCWTMPHCVLCLRLIAVGIDLYDGTKPESSLSKDQLKTHLKELPSLLELFSQCFFIGGYFVGPQFSMRKYQQFIQRNINECLPSPVLFGLKRFGIGVIYMIVHIVGSIFVPESYVMTSEFGELSFWKRNFWFCVWSKVILCKYIAAWLFAEGSVVISGLAYNGVDADGKVMWNGGANVKLRIFEGASKFEHIIASFNTNTNNWAATYIYKRLKFLGNRVYSQLVTLMFLAFWHGLHSGYYLTFFNEFIVMYFEKDFDAILKKNDRIQHWLTHPASSTFTWLVGKFYVMFFMPHCFLPFALLTSSKYLPVLIKTRALIYVFFLFWPLYSIPIKVMLKPSKNVVHKKEL